MQAVIYCDVCAVKPDADVNLHCSPCLALALPLQLLLRLSGIRWFSQGAPSLGFLQEEFTAWFMPLSESSAATGLMGQSSGSVPSDREQLEVWLKLCLLSHCSPPAVWLATHSHGLWLDGAGTPSQRSVMNREAGSSNVPSKCNYGNSQTGVRENTWNWLPSVLTIFALSKLILNFSTSFL